MFTVRGLVPRVGCVFCCSLAVACARFDSKKSAIRAVGAAVVCLGLAPSVVAAAAVAVALGLVPSVIAAAVAIALSIAPSVVTVCTSGLQKKKRTNNWSRITAVS